eukprot:SAG22_NODE_14453_length_374_cov_0.938182_1_plen_52_part_10
MTYMSGEAVLEKPKELYLLKLGAYVGGRSRTRTNRGHSDPCIPAQTVPALRY